MFETLRVIVRNGSLVLFIILQIICFFWVVSNNEHQKQIYFYSTQRYSNLVTRQYKGILDYFSLRKVNQQISDENASLIKRIAAEQAVMMDTVQLDSTMAMYEVISSNIINNSVARRNNMLTLDKGSLDGINPGMGVISNKGVVGIVTDVSAHFSLVMSLLHSKSRLSCQIPHCGFFGTLVWNGQDPGLLQLEDIQRYAEVRKGDSVVTSGYSIVFPKNILVGKIADYRVEAGSFTYSIQVEPEQDFFRLQRVYVINHRLKEEKETLEQKSVNYE